MGKISGFVTRPTEWGKWGRGRNLPRITHELGSQDDDKNTPRMIAPRMKWNMCRDAL